MPQYSGVKQDKMSFFQNLFDFEFRGSLFSADRQYQSTYKIPANSNRSDNMISGNEGPYNLLSDNILNINFAFDPELRNYSVISINVSGSTPSATTTQEVVTLLNANATFTSYFSAYNISNKVGIKLSKPRPNFRAYISNSSAEKIIKFNKKAPIRELPSYFEKYSVENRFLYPETGANKLILLDPNNIIDASIITDAGLDPLNPTPDWKLLSGTNDAYWFYKRSYTNGQLTSEIKYPAGAKSGDLAKKTFYTYDNSDLVEVMEIPYIIQEPDLLTPPI